MTTVALHETYHNKLESFSIVGQFLLSFYTSPGQLLTCTITMVGLPVSQTIVLESLMQT